MGGTIMLCHYQASRGRASTEAAPMFVISMCRVVAAFITLSINSHQYCHVIFNTMVMSSIPPRHIQHHGHVPDV